MTSFILFQFGSQLLMALAKMLSIILNESGKGGHPCLVAILNWKTISLPPLSMKLAVEFS